MLFEWSLETLPTEVCSMGGLEPLHETDRFREYIKSNTAAVSAAAAIDNRLLANLPRVERTKSEQV